MQIAEDVHKGVREVPPWGWGAIGLGGLFLLYRHQRAKAASQAVAAAPTSGSQILPTSDPTNGAYGYIANAQSTLETEIQALAAELHTLESSGLGGPTPCPPGFALVNGVCTYSGIITPPPGAGGGSCPPGYVMDDATGQCHPVNTGGGGTGGGGTGGGGGGTCPTGYHMVNGVCVADAPQGGGGKGGGTTCAAGYHDDGNGNCVPNAPPGGGGGGGGTKSCPSGYHDDGYGNCIPDKYVPGANPTGDYLSAGVPTDQWWFEGNHWKDVGPNRSSDAPLVDREGRQVFVETEFRGATPGWGLTSFTDATGTKFSTGFSNAWVYDPHTSVWGFGSLQNGQWQWQDPSTSHLGHIPPSISPIPQAH